MKHFNFVNAPKIRNSNQRGAQLTTDSKLAKQPLRQPKKVFKKIAKIFQDGCKCACIRGPYQARNPTKRNIKLPNLRCT